MNNRDIGCYIYSQIGRSDDVGNLARRIAKDNLVLPRHLEEFQGMLRIAPKKAWRDAGQKLIREWRRWMREDVKAGPF